MNAKLLYFFFFDSFCCSYSICPAELDTPSDSIAVIPEDAKLLQKVEIFSV